MTDIKQIPELPVALDAQDSDLLHLRQGPTDKQLTFSALKESIGSSSETGEGLIEVANTTEALAGVDNERSLTPLKLKQVLDTKAYATTSRNTVQNQEALSQGLSQRTGISSTTYTGNGTSQSVVTGVDMDTQWGTDPSERFGGWLWIKSRTTTGPHSIFDTVRGNTKGLSSQNTNTEYTSSVQVTSFNNNGFSVGASVVNTNPSGQDVVAWSWQTTHRASGITNRNKPYEAHYNPALGFSIVGYEGDGQSLHEVPHFLGKEPELVIVKNRDSANEWHVYYGDPDNKLVLNSTAAVTSSTSWGGTKPSNTTVNLGTSGNVNEASSGHVAYCYTTDTGVSKVGKYIGTGSAGNYVDCGFGKNKAGWVMVKNLNQTTDWRVFDLARGDNFILEPNNTDAEINSVQLEMSEGGFNLLTGSDTVNSVNNEFIFLAFADNTLTDGFTEYDYPTTDDVLTINSGTQLGFANGYDSSGGENNSLEVVPSSTTLTLGSGFENQKLYIYKDKGGNYGTTPYRPLEGTSPEQADKWGEASPLGGGTRTTAKHFNYESSTGVASASGEDSSTAWQAFDKDVELKWIVLSTSTSWLQYKYFEPRVLKSWRLREDPANTSTPRRFTIEGSNNGVSWGVVDDTYASADYPLAGPSKWGDIQEGFPQSGAYQYYRINITAQHGHPSSTAIAELELNTVTPSDFYSVSEGVMYPHADLVIQSPKALDYGWNATLTEDGFTTSQNGGAGSRTTGTYLEIGKQYKVTIDLTSTAGDLFLLQYDDDNVNISDAVALSQGYNEFTITANKVGFYLRSVHTATRTVNIGTFTVEEVVQPIERVYLGECLTGANGEVLSYESYTPAKTRGVDAEYQGDVTVHGEIKNKGVASAWVTFDGTQNPPLVSDSYNVDAVVDLGTGVYRVYSDRLTESCGISLLSSERTTEINDSSLPVSGYIDFTTRDGNGTNRDSSLVTLVIHGGTE